MELDNQVVHYDDQLSDAQLTELHKNYQHMWETLKQLEYTTASQEMQVLYQEPDNVANYEAGFFTLQIRHANDTFHFDEYAITVNNKSTFHDNDDEVILEMSQFDTWTDLENAALADGKKWLEKVKK